MWFGFHLPVFQKFERLEDGEDEMPVKITHQAALVSRLQIKPTSKGNFQGRTVRCSPGTKAVEMAPSVSCHYTRRARVAGAGEVQRGRSLVDGSHGLGGSHCAPQCGMRTAVKQ